MVASYTIFLILFTCELFKIGSVAVGRDAATPADDQGSCRVLLENDVDGYYGFPLSLKYSSRHRIELYKLFESPVTAGLNASCTVTDERSGEVVNTANFAPFRNPHSNPMDVAYAIPEATSPDNFTIRCGFPSVNSSSMTQAGGSFCILEKVTIVLKNVMSKNCTSHSVNRLANKTLKRGNLYSLRCGLPGVLKSSGKVTHEWFRYAEGHCTKELGESPEVSKSNQLRFASADFGDAGLYMCMATFNGRKLLISKYNVCIRYKPARNDKMTLLCNNGKTVTNGNVNVSCTINLSIGKVYNPGYFIWYKISNDTMIEVCNKTVTHTQRKFDCSEMTSMPTERCYQSKPPEDAAKDMRTITLTIRNVGESDFGSYQLMYYPTADMKLVSNTTVARDMTQKRKEQISTVVICVGLLGFLILLLLIGLAMKIEILWFIKKYHGKSVTCDPNIYTARFEYTYDLEKKSDESMRNTRVLVESVGAIVEKIGGTVYDEHRDVPRRQYDAENIMTMHEDCLRIILFLSPAFVEDDWSRYATYTALEATIREGKKIIFISMPGTKDAIKQIKDDSRKTLQAAMNRNVTIRWNGKVPLASMFRRHLEYALPKLKPSP